MFLVLHLPPPPPAIQPQATSLQRNGNALPDGPCTLESLCRELITKKQQLAALNRFENDLYKMGLNVLESEALSQGGRSLLNPNVRPALEKEIMKLDLAIRQDPMFNIMQHFTQISKELPLFQRIPLLLKRPQKDDLTSLLKKALDYEMMDINPNLLRRVLRFLKRA